MMEIVRVAHDDHVAGGASLPPLMDPSIVDMMEVDVRQERADDRALRRPLLRLVEIAVFEYACRHPFGDQRRIIRRSPIRCSTKRTSQFWSTLSKKD